MSFLKRSKIMEYLIKDIRFDSDDIEKCLEIYNYYILNSTATFEEYPLSLPAFKERILNITNKYPFLVAQSNGKIIGYAYLDEYNSRSAYRITADLSVYLSAAETAKGAGSALLNELIARARAQNIEMIVSLITEENAPSIAFHEKHGFKKSGFLENVGIKFKRHLGVYFYQKKI